MSALFPFGVEKAFFVWLNGQFVGYSEDTFTPSDFDLTPYIKETGNRLCVEVYKHSSASWLEDQDFFRFSGIFRSVYLYAKLPVCVEDLWLNTSLDRDLATGRMTVRLRVSGDTVSCVRCRITHDTDGEIWNGDLTLTEKDGFLFSQELVFPNVHVWDHGTPELYHVLLTVENGGYIPYDIGFRRFEMADRIMTLNGKRLIINGVNRHEWNATSGRCIGTADMEAAMEVFQRNNINAVRTCHYPNRSEWYFMCDRSGIYMMDETNLETHGSWQKDMTVDPEWNIPGSLPEWRDCVLDRANSMFQRDKNHVSICSGPAAMKPSAAATSWRWPASSAQRIPAEWCITKAATGPGVLSTAHPTAPTGVLNMRLFPTWSPACTPPPQKSGNIWSWIRRSPTSAANICTIWEIPWAAWKAM